MNLTDMLNLVKREMEVFKLKYFKGEIELEECHKETGIKKQTLKNQKWEWKNGK